MPLVDALIDAGFQATTLAALSLVPAIFVAWADDEMAWQLLHSWFTKRPSKSLWNTWKQYAEAMGTSLPKTSSGVLIDEILSLSTKVAEASGGVLGMGKISKQERKVLDEIKRSLAL